MNISRRQFAKRGVVGLAALTLATSAFKCGSEKVSAYVQTITAFLNEIGSEIPSQKDAIAKIIQVAVDFDAAYRRGDFNSAPEFFNTLVGNISTLITDLGGEIAPRVKVALAIVSSTVRLLAILLQKQGETQPAAVADGRRRAPGAGKSISLIEKLADPVAVEAAFQAAKLP